MNAASILATWPQKTPIAVPRIPANANPRFKMGLTAHTLPKTNAPRARNAKKPQPQQRTAPPTRLQTPANALPPPMPPPHPLKKFLSRSGQGLPPAFCSPGSSLNKNSPKKGLKKRKVSPKKKFLRLKKTKKFLQKTKSFSKKRRVSPKNEKVSPTQKSFSASKRKKGDLPQKEKREICLRRKTSEISRFKKEKREICLRKRKKLGEISRFKISSIQ